jgi:dimethylsulfoniopropionate demethylase
MTCRNLSKAKVGRCYYAPIIDEQGGTLNDPVALKLAGDKWWLSLADSDISLYAKGIASGLGLQVVITEPDINILAVQGPKSFKLMEKVLGNKITELKFFGFDYYSFRGNKFLIARSGWSKQGGYEIYVKNREAGQSLYDELFSAGKEFQVEPGCPNLIERIESALLSAGNDFDSTDNPYECGFDKYVDIKSDINYLGKKALEKIFKDGINKKLMGVLIDMDKLEVTESIPLYNNSNVVGDLRSATYSPNLKKVVGIAMIKKEYWDKKTPIELKIGDKKSKGTICDLPIVA